MMRLQSTCGALLAVTVLGCGGGQKGSGLSDRSKPSESEVTTALHEDDKEKEQVMAPVDPTTVDPTRQPIDPTKDPTKDPVDPMSPLGEPTSPSGEGGEPPGQPHTAPSDPSTMSAKAEIKAVTGKQAVIGEVMFEQEGKLVTIVGTFSGLKPGLHGFHLHEKGDCSGKHAKAAGGHFNPTNAKHGPPDSSQRHAGDFGNIEVDKQGNATFQMSTDSLTVVEGPDSVVGRTMIIHTRKDNGKSQPDGNAGPPMACGVIEKADMTKVGTKKDQPKEDTLGAR